MSDDDTSLLADAESTPNEDATLSSLEGEQVAPAWQYAEGMAGEGDAPEWFKGDKFKSVAAQAEAYKGLEGKMGAFTGAPEEYEISMPEDVEGEFLEDDPLMGEFKEWSKDNGVSQEAFTSLVHMFVKNEQGAYQKQEQDMESELAALGDNAKQRIQNINDYAKANLSEEHYEGILQATTSAAATKAVEALIANTRGYKVPTTETETESGMSHSEIKERLNDPRYQSDPAFRAETSKMYERKFGTGPKNTTVG